MELPTLPSKHTGSHRVLDLTSFMCSFLIFVSAHLNPLSSKSQRAYHPEEVRKNKMLEVDVDYYLKNQIHPVVSRLLDPIDGTDSGQVGGQLYPGNVCLDMAAQLSSFRRGSGSRLQSVLALIQKLSSSLPGR